MPDVTDIDPNATSLLPSQVYDKLKALVTLILPAIGAAYFSLAGIWDLPNAEKVVGSIAVLTTFLGVLLAVAAKSFNNSDVKFDGDVVTVTTEEGKTLYSLNLGIDPADIPQMKELILKVVPRELPHVP